MNLFKQLILLLQFAKIIKPPKNNVPARPAPPPEDYKKRLRLYQFTNDANVFSSHFKVPDRIPETRTEFLSETKREVSVNFESIIMKLELGFSNGNSLTTISELKNEFSENFHILMKFVTKKYIRNEYHANSRNLDLTFYLLLNFLPSQKESIANEMLNRFPLYFSLTELMFIRTHMGMFVEHEKDPILLLLYLSKQFDKFVFFANMGCDLNVLYRSIRITASDGGDRFLLKNLKANPQYAGMRLIEVIEIEHPELFVPI